MADSYNKKEREKKRRKRKQDKEEKKQQRKLEGKKEEEFMYLDENGNLTSTPPDPTKRSKTNIEDIEVSIPKRDPSEKSSFTKDGVVKFFNSEKGYGFIAEKESGESFFVHVENLQEEIKENDAVSFDVGKGPRGPVAINVKLIVKTPIVAPEPPKAGE